MKKKGPENFLDYVPRHNKNYTYDVADDGIVTIHIVWKGPYHKIATVLFRKPAVSHIDLDEIGSYIWQQIDGERTVGDIAVLMKEHFGEDMEKPESRLAKFLTILHNNKFVVYNTPLKEEKEGKKKAE